MSSLKHECHKEENNSDDKSHEIVKSKHVNQRQKEIKEPLLQKLYFL